MDVQQSKQDEAQFETLIEGLMQSQYGCCDNFFAADTVIGLRDNIQRMSAAGEMHQAGVGNKADFQQKQLFRGDRIKWLEAESDNEHEAYFLLKLGHFIKHLNKTCYTAINGFESHYASYEQKSFYKRHLDQFKTDKSRKYSIILYLNDSWQVEDGGLLSLYPADAPEKKIAPLAGRLVFFRSDEMEHEVHPSFTRERQSVAGWFKG